MADPLTWAAIGTGLAGTAMTAVGQIQQGNYAKKQAEFQARQLEQQAKEQEAAGQQAAKNRRRRSEILQSRALAIAGASGAGTLDSNVLNIISNLEVEGERAAQADLYEHRSQAELAKSQAGATRYEGAVRKKASRVSALGTAFSGLSSAATSYGVSKAPGGGTGGGGDPYGFQMR